MTKRLEPPDKILRYVAVMGKGKIRSACAGRHLGGRIFGLPPGAPLCIVALEPRGAKGSEGATALEKVVGESAIQTGFN